MAVIFPNSTTLTHYSFELALDNETFTFEFRWNDRAASWFMSIRDVNSVELISGRRVVLGFPLLNRFADPLLPKGELSAIDTTGSNVEAGLNDLGGRVKLIYTPADEIPEEFKA